MEWYIWFFVAASLVTIIGGIAGGWKWIKSSFKGTEPAHLGAQLDEHTLADPRREAAKVDSADLKAQFIKIDPRKALLRISNGGPASAFDLEVDFPDEEDPPIAKNELEQKFPLEVLEPGLDADVSMYPTLDNTPSKLAIQLTWKNSRGEPQEKRVYAIY